MSEKRNGSFDVHMKGFRDRFDVEDMIELIDRWFPF